MSGLRVVPSRRQGRERVYVCLPDGADVAWFDRDAARVNILRQDLTEEVLQVLRPYLSGAVTVGPPPVPTASELARLALHPDDDLAPNRPGEALRIALDREPAPARRLRPDPRRRALAAEEAVGEVLERMEGAGYQSLHSVLLPGGDRIHHLLIGPGGLFALHTLPAHRRRVRIAAPAVDTGRGRQATLLDRIRACADRATHVLAVEVRPVLVLVEPQSVQVTAPAPDVRVVRDGDLPTLGRHGVVLKPADVESLYATARDRHTWLRL
ncbi:hypothetical protein GCM10018793_40400 [Streptomyces sulfonofaciens]|uniref:NERD domain-containing protein n=1 Tax=Streptomyces sulfonofaciens TaxID=68272 RepID=A0A919GDA1_9ACTN|nr:nuclease-related domain-containing protein [Streptomyces sulfonofaciens]GHH81901.1 hypothetical protein GCM10018793_40400 [Streptomyces sulfonofaciens]